MCWCFPVIAQNIEGVFVGTVVPLPWRNSLETHGVLYRCRFGSRPLDKGGQVLSAG